MRILYGYLRNYWKLAATALVLAAINQIFSLLDPWIFRFIIDNYATKYSQYTSAQFIQGVGWLLAAAVGVAFVSRVAKNFQDYCVNLITQQVGARIYADGIRHSLELPYTLFEDQRSGETLGKLQKVRTDVEKLITMSVNLVFTTLIGLVFVIVYASRVHWSVVPAYLLTVPLLGGLSRVLSRKIKEVQKHIVRETTALAGATTESLRNIELVKSLGLAQQEIERLNATTAKILKLELKKVRYLRSLSFVQGTCVNLLRTSILFLMLYLIFTQRITVGQFFSLFIYSFFIFGPLQELGNVINVYRETEVSLNNFETILNLPPEPRPAHPVAVDFLDQLRFDRVSFQHQSASSPALREISFEVNRGETIAFVGPSGAGKTTLVKLLVGLYRPQHGHIFYNGVPEDEIAIDRLRERIGFVTQDAQLFSGSIRENLRFVRPEATDQECMQVLDQAAVQGLLSRADQGLDTVIGEGGIKVSGGEKQRLSIARALLRKPQLLVFDEATSSLDSLTEEEISQTIRDVAASRDAITCLIAHRLSTVLHADRIYVLERGKIVEFGHHSELLANKGLYYAMWRQQVGESSGDFAVARSKASRPPAGAPTEVGAQTEVCPTTSGVYYHGVMRVMWCGVLCLAAVAQTGAGEWRSLFDGKTLAGWRETPFAGHGKVRVENGAILLGAGAPMTGVTYTGSFVKGNYEIRFEAARLDGNDFFASLTFPVGDSFCTWVTGGWGGDIVGLSSIDGWDASDNETRTYFDFEKARYYAFRLRVTADRLTAWIDEKQIIDAPIAGRTISLRPGEMKLSAPLGFASYGTVGGVRKVEYRSLP